MASTAHGTLTANTVATVTINVGVDGFVVVNRDQAGAIWVRADGTNPVIAAADTYVVLGARMFPSEWQNLTPGVGTVTLKLISDTARTYSVEAVA